MPNSTHKTNWINTILLVIIAVSFGIIMFLPNLVTEIKEKVTGGRSEDKPEQQERNTLRSLVKSQIGVKELQGTPSNPEIEEYLKASGYDTLKDDTPWCGAFVTAMLKKAGYYISSQPLRARSYETARGEDLPEYNNVVNFEKAIPYHTVVVFWRNSPTAGTGHVGFYAGHTDTKIKVCGGNQSDEVNDTLWIDKERLTRAFNPEQIA